MYGHYGSCSLCDGLLRIAWIHAQCSGINIDQYGNSIDVRDGRSTGDPRQTGHQNFIAITDTHSLECNRQSSGTGVGGSAIPCADEVRPLAGEYALTQISV